MYDVMAMYDVRCLMYDVPKPSKPSKPSKP